MRLKPRHLAMPLLAKELVEQAARKRTYVVRVLYAALLFVAYLLVLYSWTRSYTYDPFMVLGRGGEIFTMLMVLQFGGIYLFLPAMMCGAIANEKERDTFALLLITDLRPWEIVLSKYLGRLWPMLTFVLLALPLMSLAYAIGGVTTERIVGGFYALVLCCLQVGAFTLMLSAFCRSSAAAFIGTYILGGLIYFVPIFIAGVLELAGITRLMGPPLYLLAHAPWFILVRLEMGRAWGGGAQFSSLQILAWGWVVWGSILLFLALARVFLVRRAFVPPRSPLLSVFRFFDRLMSSANRVTGGVMLVRPRGELPGDEPIAWREVSKKALGQARYLFRILALIMTPVILLAAGMIYFGIDDRFRDRDGGMPASVFMMVLWPLALLLLGVQAAGAVASERSHQTLDVLLTTPMTGRQIVLEKMRGVRRMTGVLLVPFLTLIGLKTWWEWSGVGHWHADYYSRWDYEAGPLYLVGALLCVFVYLPLASWVAMWIGLKTRSQIRAIILTLAVIVGWCAIPPVVVGIGMELAREDDFAPLMLASPATFVVLNEVHELHQMRGPGPLGTLVWNFVIYIPALLLFRWQCLRQADRLLGRVQPDSLGEPLTPRASTARAGRV